ncbi:MAG: preprotein translocase subunit SecG [Chitinophagaceae bacterium]|nr:MAG: preprotein translocase subunit SecG [Chitinophagaceae bacterium]
MLVFFGILVLIASVILGFIILVQNPKGGGMSGVLGGFSNQLIGVKQSTDIMEKGTWIFAGIVGLLCVISPAFIPEEGGGNNDKLLQNVNTKPQTQQARPATPANPSGTVTLPGTQTTPTPAP